MSFYDIPFNFNIDFSLGLNYFTPTFSAWQNQTSVFTNWLDQVSCFPAWQSSSPVCSAWQCPTSIFPAWNSNADSYNSIQKSNSSDISSASHTTRISDTIKTSPTQEYKIGQFNLDFWKTKGYDHTKGKELALDAAKVIRGTPGQCVGYTRKTINRIYGTNFSNAGAAEKFGTTILSQPELKNKFKKADMKDIEKGGIPDGAVVLWKGGSPGFTKGKAALYGHGGICYQGKVYSNYVETRHIKTCSEIWVPVSVS